jgi:hypothetical protein
MVERISQPESTSDNGALAAQVSSAVLKFRQAGVEHVIITDSGGGLTLLFLNNAESQHYYPRYGGDTNNGFQALLAAGALPKDQLNGTMGLGWVPGFDVPGAANADNGPYSNAARRHCIQLMHAHGQSFSDPNAELVALTTCDQLYFIQDTLNAAPVPTRAGYLDAVNALGSRFVSGETFRTLFGADHHAGVASYRDWMYVAGCSCMHYTGPLHDF